MNGHVRRTKKSEIRTTEIKDLKVLNARLPRVCVISKDFIYVYVFLEKSIIQSSRFRVVLRTLRVLKMFSS